MVSQIFFQNLKKAKKTTKSRMSKEKPDKKKEKDLGLDFQDKTKEKSEKQKIESMNFYFRSCKAVGERCDSRRQAHDDT